MTEPFEVTPDPAPEPVAEVPATDADPQDVAEQAAAAEPGWLIDVRNNAPAWIVAALEDLLNRLVRLGG